MGFKFAGTSPGNSAENYSAVATDGYNDGPLHMQRTVIGLCHTRYVFLSLWILGHTRRNLRRGVARAMDHRRGTVARLMKSTRPDPAAPFSKFDRLYSPALHIPPHYFQLPLISPLFSTSTLPPLIITPTISPNLITIIYLSVLLLLLSTLPPESFPTCVFSISKVCVSKFILISLVFLFIS